MDQWKGHEIIWEALRLMRNRARVTVYQSDWGWEPNYSHFKRNAPENVRFIRAVARARIAEYYRGASLVIGQMKIGHFGMTEVEAAACGVPVVVYLQDKKTPFLPKESDPRSLAEAIDGLVEDEKMRETYAESCTKYVLMTAGLGDVSRKFTGILDSKASTVRSRPAAKITLYPGSVFEVVGRILGERLFGLLKAHLIGL